MVSSPRSKLAFLPPRNDQQLLSLGYISKICSSLTTIKYCLSKYHQKRYQRKVAQTPAHCSFFISQSSFCKLTDDQNNEKPRREGQNIFLDPSLRASSPVLVSEVSLARTRERGGRGKESLQRSLINFHFHPGNPGTPQSVKTVAANVPQIRKVTTTC